MWQVLEGRKWRPPPAMYSSPLHAALREFARQELSETANFQSLHVRADLSEAKKVLPSDGEARVQKRVAVLMVAEIIPPAAISAMCAQPLEELTPERVTFAIQTSMGNLSPDGTIKAVYGFLKFWDCLRKTGRSFDKISHLDVSEYLSVVHGEATQGSGGSAGTGAEVLIDADGSDDDVLPEDVDEQDQLLETIDDVWRGYSAASGQRSLLVRLEKNFHFPMGSLQSKVPQVGQGARLTAPRRHAVAPSPLTFRAVQTYVERDDTDPIMANIGSSFLLSGVSTKRATQLQNICFYAENETVAAARVPKKDASGKGRYEDILVYKPGVGRSDKWWKKHQEFLRDVRKGKFSYRDYYFVDSDGKRHQCKDPRKANRRANCAMPAWKITHAIRYMLQEATGLSAEEVRRITKHSGRTFLHTCSKMRGEPLPRQLELGAWFGSSVALDGLPANEVLSCQQQMVQARTPGGYSSASTTARLLQIVKENCEAVYQLTSQELGTPLTQISGGFEVSSQGVSLVKVRLSSKSQSEQ